ncbi:hypothetical protein [Phocaeicola dorei]|uniref:hypothetical protein n=1 Tax=Phocaeicola dorei TaxID=357276 RepID=UPI00215C5FAC|nr:hypothetical protein [Phocaeicola dorei]
MLIFCKFTLLKPYKQLYYNILIYRTPLKIFNSNGEIEYNDEECNMIKEYASLCSPAFIDAINKLLLE